MAKTAKLIITAEDRASKALRGIRGAADDAKVAFGQLAKVAAVAGTAFAAFTAKAISMSNKQETVLRQLDLALGKIGVSYADVGKSISKFAAEQQAATRYGDDQTQRVLTQLVRVTGEFNEQTLEAARLIQDMAEAEKQDLASAGRIVSQAMSGQISMLGRYVPALKGLSREQIAAMSSAEQQALVLKALRDQYEGTASNIAPLEQRMANLANTVGDVMEAFGDAVKSGGEFEEGIDKVIEVLRELEEWIKENKDEISNTFTSMFEPLLILGGGVSFVIKGLVQSLQTLGATSATVAMGLQAQVVAWKWLFGTEAEYEEAGKAFDWLRAHAAAKWDQAEKDVLATEELYEKLIALFEKGPGAGGDAGEMTFAPLAVGPGAKAPSRRERARAGKPRAEKPGVEMTFEVEPRETERVAFLDWVDEVISSGYAEYQEGLLAGLDETTWAIDRQTEALEREKEAAEELNAVLSAMEGAQKVITEGLGALSAAFGRQSKIVQMAIIAQSVYQAAYEVARAVQSAACYDYWGAAAHTLAAVKFGLLAGRGVQGLSAAGGRGRGGDEEPSAAGQRPSALAATPAVGVGEARAYTYNVHVRGAYVHDKRELGRVTAEAQDAAQQAGMTGANREAA